MTPILWLMASNVLVWAGFGLYAYVLWRGHRGLQERLKLLERQQGRNTEGKQ